jgi:anaerobic dimethyl sulfoxide reductase subunit A
MKIIKKINVSCNKDCGGGCPLTAYVENNRIVKITNNKLAPEYFTGCPRGFLFQKVLYSKERLLSPLIRTGKRGDGKFKSISWDKAYEVISAKIKEIIENYGTHSILPFPGSGSCRGVMHNTDSLSKRFFSLLGECTWTCGNYSSEAVSYAMPFILGTNNCGIDPLTLKQSKQIILWGADISTTRFDAQLENILFELKKNGIPIIVIDPRESRTVKKLATNWIKTNPASDTAFMSAIAYTLITQKLVNMEFIKKHTVDFKEYSDYILGITDNIPKSPEWASNICGTPATTIKYLAEQYSSIKPTALIPGLSIQRTIGGEEASRAAVILQTLTGNIGVKGGTSGGRYWNSLPIPNIPSIFNKKLVVKNKIPVYKWPDAILNNDPANIKLIYNIGSNLLNQGSDINKNIKALNYVDFIVTHDSFLTPTGLC